MNQVILSGVADPSPGQFYIPNVLQVAGAAPGTYVLLQYDLAQNKTSDIAAPGAPDHHLMNYSAMWSPYLQKLVVFGDKEVSFDVSTRWNVMRCCMKLNVHTNCLQMHRHC